MNSNMVLANYGQLEADKPILDGNLDTSNNTSWQSPSEYDQSQFYPTVDYSMGMDFSSNDQMNFLMKQNNSYLPQAYNPMDYQMNLSTSSDLTRTDSFESQFSSDQLNSSALVPSTALSNPMYYPNMPYPYSMGLPLSSTNGGLPDSSYWSSQLAPSNNHKRVFSFVSMAQSKIKKRVRRRFDEIDRAFLCTHSGCTKSYGTLNNLNAHILMQSHGPKRRASEFKSTSNNTNNNNVIPSHHRHLSQK